MCMERKKILAQEPKNQYDQKKTWNSKSSIANWLMVELWDYNICFDDEPFVVLKRCLGRTKLYFAVDPTAIGKTNAPTTHDGSTWAHKVFKNPEIFTITLKSRVIIYGKTAQQKKFFCTNNKAIKSG